MKRHLDPYHSIAVGYPIGASAFPHHPAGAWLQALWWSCRLIRAFDAAGSSAALPLVERAPLQPPWMRGAPLTWQIRKAQLDAAALRSALHFLLDARACFAESLALCAGLRCLGWECCVLVGYACVEVFASTSLHAWVEYRGIPVSDLLDVRYGYTELFRVPQRREEPDVS